jgi:Flp pilus assembly protein TadD
VGGHQFGVGFIHDGGVSPEIDWEVKWNRFSCGSVSGIMKNMRRPWLIITLLLAGLTSAFAQQPSPELDTLFAKLRSPDVGSEALRIEPKIWSLWMQGGSAADNDKLAIATQSMNLGAFELADKQMTELLATSANFAEAWNKRATLYYLMGRLDDSLADIVKVLDLEPRHFGALSGRGMILQRQGKNAEALAAYKEALSMNPTMVGPRIAVQQLEKLVPEL